MKRFLPAILALFLLAGIASSAALPDYVGYVNDFAGVLGQDARIIESNIAYIEDKTTAEIAVVTIPEFPENYDTLTYGVELFEKWGIGKADRDNGLLILLSVKEKKWRIEVGYGLEPIINDAKAGRIGREYLEPALESGNYSSGVNEAVIAIGQEIMGAQDSGEYIISDMIDSIDPVTAIIVVVIIIILIVVLALTGNIWVVWLILRIILMLLSGGRGGGFGGGKSGGGGAGN
ncbi:MAG: TPM domain-containing protein [Candidatus Aenigmarchaeota archaeon]|nr:TPM domain-containing protein [Candidatus Aenigmarchaeota archaeon]